jgi:hypothetical protein
MSIPYPTCVSSPLHMPPTYTHLYPHSSGTYHITITMTMIQDDIDHLFVYLILPQTSHHPHRMIASIFSHAYSVPLSPSPPSSPRLVLLYSKSSSLPLFPRERALSLTHSFIQSHTFGFHRGRSGGRRMMFPNFTSTLD